MKAPDYGAWYEITFTEKKGTNPTQCELKYDDASEPDVIGSISKGIFKIEGE